MPVKPSGNVFRSSLMTFVAIILAILSFSVCYTPSFAEGNTSENNISNDGGEKGPELSEKVKTNEDHQEDRVENSDGENDVQEVPDIEAASHKVSSLDSWEQQVEDFTYVPLQRNLLGAPNISGSSAYAIVLSTTCNGYPANSLIFTRSATSYSENSSTIQTLVDRSGRSWTGYVFNNFETTTYNNWRTYKASIIRAAFVDYIYPTRMYSWFDGCTIMTRIDGMAYLDTSRTEKMAGLFNQCLALTSIDLSHFDTSNVTDMDLMFASCKSLTTLDVSTFNTSKVTTMDFMFGFNPNGIPMEDMGLTEIRGLENFDTSKVHGMMAMFQSCGNLTTLNLSSFSSEKVDSVSSMFFGCSKLETINFSSSWKPTLPTSYSGMFSGCSSLRSINTSGWGTASSTSFEKMFYNCSKLSSIDVSSFNTANATAMANMFYNCSSLQSLDLSSFNTANVGKMNGMFNNCTRLAQIKLGPNFSFVGTSGTLYQAYLPSPARWKRQSDNAVFTATKLSTQYTSSWAGTYNLMQETFACFDSDAGTLTFYSDYPYTHENYEVIGTKTYYKGFETSEYSITSRPWYSHLSEITEVIFNTDVYPDEPNWFNGMDNLTTLTHWSRFHVTSKCTSTAYMFYGCHNLTYVDVSGFDTSNVTSMDYMFGGIDEVDGGYMRWTRIDGLANLNLSKTTSLYAMFNGSGALTDLSGVKNWDTSKVEDFRWVFWECSSVEELDIGNWDMSSATGVVGFLGVMTSLGKLTLPSTAVLKANGDTARLTGEWQHPGDPSTAIPASQLMDFQPSMAGTWERTLVHYAVFDSSTGVLTFFKDSVGKYTNGQVDGTKTYYANFADTTYFANSTSIPWNAIAANVKKVSFTAPIEPACGNFFFYGMSQLTEIENFSNLKIGTRVTTIWSMFNGCSSLSMPLDVGHWDMSNVTKLSYCFSNCTSLTTITGTENWHTATLTDFKSAFYNCQKLTSLDLSGLDVSGVKDISWTFANCYMLTSVGDISAWTTPQVTTTYCMFQNCRRLRSIDLPLFGNSSALENTAYMFTNCWYLVSVDISSLNNASATNTASMFSTACYSLRRIKLGDSFRFCGNTTTYPSLSSYSSSWRKAGTTSPAYSSYDFVRNYAGGTQAGWWEASGAVAVFDPNSKTLRFKKDWMPGPNGTVSNGVRYFAVTENVDAGTADVAWNEIDAQVEHVVFESGCCRPWSMSQWFRDMGNLKDCTGMGNIDCGQLTYITSMFYNCSSLTQTDVGNLSTSLVKNLNWTFAYCKSLTSLDLSNWNTSAVTSLASTFRECSSLETVETDNWTISGVTSLETLFYKCENLKSVDVASWDTSSVTSMGWTFYGCENLESVDVGSWSTSSASNLKSMFAHCRKLANINTASWNTGAATDMSYMFYNCSSLQSISVGSWDTGNSTNFAYMFANCSLLETIATGSWNTGKVKSLEWTFYGCSSLKNLDVSSWNTGSVTNMLDTFYGCSSLENLNVSAWNTSSATTMKFMFGYCSSLGNLDVEHWNTGAVKDMAGMFCGCSGLTAPNVSTWDTSKVQSMLNMFRECPSMVTIPVGNWNVSSVKNMSGMFSNSENLQTLNVRNWTTSSVEDMSYLFRGCGSLQELDVSLWDTSSVTNMEDLFALCTSLTELDVSNWDVTSVENMNELFHTCQNISELDVSQWKTDSVTTMYEIFARCYAVEELDVEDWNVSSVTNLSGVFAECHSLTALDVTNWDTAQVTDMSLIFSDCLALKTLDLSTWDTSNVVYMNSMFRRSKNLLTVNLGHWESGKVENFKSIFENASKIKRIYCENDWDVSVDEQSTFVFTGCSNLIGEYGSVYSGGDLSHAVVDSGENSGYFSKMGASTTYYQAGLGNFSDGSTVKIEAKTSEGETVCSMTEVPTRPGYVFAGWSATQTAQSDPDVMRYAQWQAVSVTYHGNGGLIGAEQDAVRSYIPYEEIAHSDNLDENAIPDNMSSFSAYSGTFDTSKAVSVPGASRIETSLVYSTENDLDQISLEHLGVRVVEDADGNAIGDSGNITGGDGISQESVLIPLTGNSVTFRMITDLGREHYGFRAIVRGLDSSGDVVLSAAENPVTAPVRQGYTFDGWTNSSTGSTAIWATTRDVANDASKATANMDVFAKYTPNSYTISFNSNVGSNPHQALWASGATADVSAEYDTPATLSANGFTAQGYTFLGWNTAADGSGQQFDDQDDDVMNLSSTDGATVTLYAMWQFTGEVTGIDELNPDLDHDGFGDNIAFSAPTDITFVAKASGDLMAPSNALIQNRSDFGIRVSSVKSDVGAGWAFVSGVDFPAANANNTMRLSFGPSADMIEISECTSKKTVSNTAWSIPANNGTVSLAFSGKVKNLKTTSADFGEIHWYVKAVG